MTEREWMAGKANLYQVKKQKEHLSGSSFLFSINYHLGNLLNLRESAILT
jgi:hypothetical protein